jgi:hypothetical protein
MKFREIPLIILGYGSRLRTTGGYRVRSLPGIARPPRDARRRPAGQARRARLRRADGADQQPRQRAPSPSRRRMKTGFDIADSLRLARYRDNAALLEFDLAKSGGLSATRPSGTGGLLESRLDDGRGAVASGAQ